MAKSLFKVRKLQYWKPFHPNPGPFIPRQNTHTLSLKLTLFNINGQTKGLASFPPLMIIVVYYKNEAWIPHVDGDVLLGQLDRFYPVSSVLR